MEGIGDRHKEEDILALNAREPQKGILHDPCPQAEAAWGMLAALVPPHLLAQTPETRQGSS